jgi:tRNA-uridine 2-sulfurtransferase
VRSGRGEKIIVGMSGGVDSCVAAALLVEQGYEVIGVTMRLWTVDRPGAKGHQHCCSVEDGDDAAEVASMLGIPHFVLNFEQEFSRHVVDPFVRGYAGGQTPNPCQACNEHIKFRALMQRAAALDTALFATGHYARIRERDGTFELLAAADGDKDQTYFLYTLGQDELRRLRFPLGDLNKTEVRAAARRMGLPVADKPDSEEICFVPDNDYRRFLRERIPSPVGEIVDAQGNTLGRHSGIYDFTVGQRRGLGAFGNRRYVIELLPAENRVVVGDEAQLLCSGVELSSEHWTSGVAPKDGERVSVKCRYKTAPVGATVRRFGNVIVLDFDEPQRAVSPGQAAVCYDREVLRGGGTIVKSLPRDIPETSA